MYHLSDYRRMVEDEVRTSAYVEAIRAAVRPGDAVVELGTGFGYFAVVACRAGASRVTAVEPNPAVHLGRALARANGCGDRIEFVHDVSTKVSVPPADVLFSDMRGVLPLHGEVISALIDARTRLLRPAGIQIPACDRLWLALVAERDPHPAPVEHGVALDPLDEALSHQWRSVRLRSDELLSDGVPWFEIDYRTVTDPDCRGAVDVFVTRAGRASGIGVWFDTELYGGRGFSTAPGAPETVYGQALFPLPEPLALEAGDRLRVEMRAKLVGDEYVWSWSGRVMTGGARDVRFARSTFFAQPLDAAEVRKRGDRFVPGLGREGAAVYWILGRMDSSAALGEIAAGALAEFPDVFGDLRQALRCVGDLSRRYSP